MLAKFINCYESISQISKNDNNESLVYSDIKLYNLDKISVQENLSCYKTPDAIQIKEKNIFLIEFKGGEEILNFNLKDLKKEIKTEKNELEKYKKIIKLKKKKEIEESLKLKLTETMLFILPQILKKDFKKILDEFKIWYIVIVSDKIILHPNIQRNRMSNLSNYPKSTELGLKKYNKNSSMLKVITENTTFFNKKIVEHLITS